MGCMLVNTFGYRTLVRVISNNQSAHTHTCLQARTHACRLFQDPLRSYSIRRWKLESPRTQEGRYIDHPHWIESPTRLKKRATARKSKILYTIGSKVLFTGHVMETLKTARFSSQDLFGPFAPGSCLWFGFHPGWCWSSWRILLLLRLTLPLPLNRFDMAQEWPRPNMSNKHLFATEWSYFIYRW